MAEEVAQQQTTDTTEEDLIRLSLDEWIYVKRKNDRDFEADYMLMINF